MRAVAKIFYLSAALLVFTSCGNLTEETATGSSENTSAPETEGNETNESNSIRETEETDMDKTNDVPAEESKNTDPINNASENSNSTASDANDKQALSPYSNEQIEYARVWLQLGTNQDIDGLYVEHIPAGTPLNPDDDTSGTYPEPVIQLAGSRLVDGSVTYSGNGDGTINVYNVPLRWDGEYPAGGEFYTEIIDNTELVAIDVGKDEEVIRLIKLLQDES